MAGIRHADVVAVWHSPATSWQGEAVTVEPGFDALFDLPAPAPDPVVAACPAGPLLTAAYGPFGLGTASFDADRAYRFRLSRVWDRHRDRCCFVMLNPSTADERTVDPTVRRCISFAQAWGFGAVEVVNLYAFRATRPEDLLAAPAPVAPERSPEADDLALLAAATTARLTVAAWGVVGAQQARADRVRDLLTGSGIALHVLRLTQDGHPGHPLYVRAAARPLPWR